MRTPILLTTLFVAALAGGTAHAASKDAWLIILGGGDKDADAESAVDLWPRLAGGLLKPAAGFPKKLVSDTVKGLNPGFKIGVAGFCADVKMAERLRDLLRLSAPGVYLRRVQGVTGDSCPKVVPAKLGKTDKVTTFTRKRLDRQLKGIDWELAFPGTEIIAGDEKYYTDLRLRVLAGKTPLSELTLTSSFTPDKDGIGSGIIRSPHFITLGHRTLVLVTEENRQGGAATVHNTLYGFFGGAVRELGQFKPYLDLRATGDDWRELRGVVPGKTVAEGEYFVFDDKKGVFVHTDPSESTPMTTGGDKPPRPIIFDGCGLDEDCCITSDKLAADVEVVREPTSGSKVLTKLKAGTKVAKVELLQVIDQELAEITVVDADDCANAPADAPTKAAWYLYYAEEGWHHVWMDGGFTDVRDDCLSGNPMSARPGTWARVTLKSGKIGYVDSLASFDQSGDGECLYGQRPQPLWGEGD